MYKKYTVFLNSYAVLALCCFLNLSAQKINLPEQGDNPRARLEEFNKKRMYPFDKIPDNAIEKAFQQKKEMTYKLRKSDMMVQAQQSEWKPLGPANIGGR